MQSGSFIHFFCYKRDQVQVESYSSNIRVALDVIRSGVIFLILMDESYLIKEWYVIRTQSRSEEKVRDFFLLNGFDARVFYREHYYKRNGQVYKSNKLLFSGYVFIITDLDALSFDKRVTDLRFKFGQYFRNLKYDDEGTPALSREEKRFLLHLAGEDDIVEMSEGFIEGDRVIITSGPLSGLESNIVYIDRHKRIAKLMMDFLGTDREVSVPLEIIYKV